MKKIVLAFLFLFFVFAGTAFAFQDNSSAGIIEEMSVLVLQLGLILFAAKIGAVLFNRLKMPEILGELISGMVIGPYFLGGIHLPVLNGSLFPITSTFPISVELYGFMTVASIVLLFMVGLETNLEVFLRYSLAGSFVGIGGVILSFLLGDFCAVVFSKSIFGIQYNFLDPIPLFLGVIATATSVGISARILSDKKMMQSPEGVTIISGAIIDDVLGVILLAIVLLIAKSGNVKWAQIGVIALRSVILWIGFTVLGLVFSFRISGFLKKFKDTSTISVLALGLALMLAGIFEKGGLAMIIGAYVMGLSISKTDLVYVIRERLVPLQRFFVPMFFCIMGMMVDFSTLFSRHVLFFGVVYGLLGVVGKVVGCGLPVLFLNFNLRGALRVGLGMTPRGEVALIITGIGIAAGILQKDLIAAVIFMLLLNTLVSPIALSISLRSKKSGIKKFIPFKNIRREIKFDMPTAETTDLVLGRILQSFTQEGFFVQKVETDRKLFQIRKEQTFIGIDVAEEALIFECQEDDVIYVHTLVYEVLVDLENSMRYLKNLTNKEFEARRELRLNGKKKISKKFLEYILPNAVKVNLKGANKYDIIEEMVDLLVYSGQIDKKVRESVLQDIFEREETMSTGLQDGVAMPHSKTVFVKDIVCAIGVKKDGVDFDSLDEKLSNIIVMIISPKDEAGPHIRFMADISQLLMDENRRKKVLDSATDNDLYFNLTAFL